MEKDPIYNTSKNDEKMNMNAYMPPTKEEKQGVIIRIFIALSLAIVFFFSGMATLWLALDSEIRTLVKLKNTIDNKYYKDTAICS